MPEQRGCIANSILFLTIVFVPLLGQALATIFILGDGRKFTSTILWLLAVWFLPFLGPFLYLMFGQARQSVRFGQANSSTLPGSPSSTEHHFLAWRKW